MLLELFNNIFMNIAEHAGTVLQNTSRSVNIKERLDFSCAIFDAEGNLVANAPHVPVHLGAMGESVRTVLRRRGATLHPGDVIALNNPFNGGTHLPDITVITPVFDSTGNPSSSLSAAVGITPISAASRRARHRLTRIRSKKKASSSMTSSWSIAANFAKLNFARC